MKKNYLLYMFLLAGTVLILSGCSNAENVNPCLSGKTYGLLHGLWHGIIAPIDLILMLFRDDISVFAVNNNGFGYSLGFLIGSGGWGILGGKSIGKSRN